MKFNLRVFSLLVFILAGHLAACVTSPAVHLAQTSSKKEALPKPILTGRAHVYDGDSIFFGSVEVRLDAIDAPERDQACRDRNGKFWACGIVSRDVLHNLVGSEEVQCVIKGRDKYRQLLGICFVGSRDLNAAMVARGYAIAYHHFSEKYAPEESRAQAQTLGIWQDAAFTEPYYCRHFAAGHTCYEYNYAENTGRVAELPLIGKSHAVGAPD